MTDVSFPVIKVRNYYDITTLINLLRRGTGVGYVLVTSELRREDIERRIEELYTTPRSSVRALWTSLKKS